MSFTTARVSPAHVHSNTAAPGRLRAVVARAHLLGIQGVDVGSALERIQSDTWGDGILPLDRPSQRRAWDVTHRHAFGAYRAGTDLAVRRIARDVVAKFGGATYRALYVTAWLTAEFADSDTKIVSAVAEALTAAGYAAVFGNASPTYPIRRARSAFGRDDQCELASFVQARVRTVH